MSAQRQCHQRMSRRMLLTDTFFSSNYSNNFKKGIHYYLKGKRYTVEMLLNKKIPLSYTFGRIKNEIFFTSAIWLAAYFLAHEYGSANPEIPVSVPAFIGTSISIILSFKLNQSYDRWWEARKIWGSIVN